MRRAPTRAAIHAAELRIAEASQGTRDSLCRARAALRATLARPSTLALAAVGAGVFGFWFARKSRPRAAARADGAAVAKTSAAGLALAFIMRYGAQGLPFILEQIKSARGRRAARMGADVSKWTPTDYRTTGVRPLN